MNPNQLFYDPMMFSMPPNYGFGNQMFMNQPRRMYRAKAPKKKEPSPFSRTPSLHLPAIILFGFSWILHAIATFIPYWSTYSGISDSRAGWFVLI